jgi:hypothetical protein
MSSQSGKGVPDGLMIGGSLVDSSSYRAASMKCASVWSNGEGFAAIRIGFPLSLPFNTLVIGGRNQLMLVQPWSAKQHMVWDF